MTTPITLLSLNIEGDKHLHRIEPFLRERTPLVVTMQEVHESASPKLASFGNYDFHYIPMSSYVNERRKGLLIMWDKSLTCTSIATHTYHEYPDASLPREKRLSNERDRILAVVTLTDGVNVFRIATTHFIWTPDGNPDELQYIALESLLSELGKYNDEHGIILTGDFNAPRGLPIFDSLAKRYKDNIPKDITTTIDQELHRVKGITLVVDGLFTSPNYQVNNVEVINQVSDHMAILSSINK